MFKCGRLKKLLIFPYAISTIANSIFSEHILASAVIIMRCFHQDNQISLRTCGVGAYDLWNISKTGVWVRILLKAGLYVRVCIIF